MPCIHGKARARGAPGIMPGGVGIFSFCTFERDDVIVPKLGDGLGSGPAGWAHTWDADVLQVFIFHGDQSVPGRRIEKLIPDGTVPEFEAPAVLLASVGFAAAILLARRRIPQ